MKKIFFLIILFFAFNKNIYGAYTDWSLDIKSNQYMNIEKEYRYRWYTEEKEGNYYLEGYNEALYPSIDYNDYVYTDYSQFSLYKAENSLNREFETRSVYAYKEVLPVRYIHISDVQGSDGIFRVPELEIIVDNKKINYEIYCEGCSNNFYEHISNNNEKENNSYITNGGYLRIDLKENYYLSDLIVNIYIYDIGSWYKRININYNRNIDKNYEVFAKFNYYDYFWCLDEEHPRQLSPKLTSKSLSKPIYSAWLSSLEEKKSAFDREVMVSTEYRYRDKLFKYYNTKRIYYDKDYYTYIKDYIKDEKDYKIYYRYELIDNTNYIDKIIYEDRIINRDNVIYKDKIIYKDRIINKDNIVYKDRIIYQDYLIKSLNSNGKHLLQDKVLDRLYTPFKVEKENINISNIASKYRPIIIWLFIIIILILVIIIIKRYKKYVENNI